MLERHGKPARKQAALSSALWEIGINSVFFPLLLFFTFTVCKWVKWVSYHSLHNIISVAPFSLESSIESLGNVSDFRMD